MPAGDRQYNNLASLDPAKKASAGLDNAMKETVSDEQVVILDPHLKAEASSELQEEVDTTLASEESGEEKVAPTEALKEAPVLEYVSDRDQLRLLIVTRDVSITNAGGASQKRVLELSEMFAEIHIIVLTQKLDMAEKKARITNNAWIYATDSTSLFRAGFDAIEIANDELLFTDGFRADIIIAEDPFECALVSHELAKKYKRPFQIHVFQDFFSRGFRDAARFNRIRLLIARFMLKEAACIRVKSEYVLGRLKERYPERENDIEMLPMYHNLSGWRDATPAFDMNERYPQFKLHLLHVSSMSAHSRSLEVIDGVARVLRQYPTLGLIIIGTGRLRNTLEKRAIKLGIRHQVIFENGGGDVISYMKSSDLLLHLSEDPDDDVTVLQAAAVGLPMIVGVKGLPGDLFLDGESAFVCQNDSPPCVTQKVNKFLNQNDVRATFAIRAQEVIFDRIQEDYDAFIAAYKESIERCLKKQS